jgi:putative transposase
LCGYFGVSRSGYYKESEKAVQKQSDEQVVLEMVDNIRRWHPRMGCKKLYKLLKAGMEEVGIKLGRDKFQGLLKRNKRLIKKRRKYAYTTDSFHSFRVYKNLLKGRELTQSHQAWVSDITYLRTSKGFVYLFLITDAYSRKIVGWDVSPSLAIEGGVKALKMAIKQCPDTKELIHHSDRGIQYCSKGYKKVLKKAKIEISMTEENHCYENATAERVNGILKQEYGLDETFISGKLAIKAVKEAIRSYNMERPHWSLNLATPEQMHKAA